VWQKYVGFYAWLFFPSLFPLSFSVPEATLAHFQSIILIFFFQFGFCFFIAICFILNYP